MKKSKRPIVLNLENLETRVVPSHPQGMLEPNHVMGADSAITAELEAPKGDNGNPTSQESDIGKIKLSTDEITSAALDNADHHGQSNAENHSDTVSPSDTENHSDTETHSVAENQSDSSHTDNSNSNRADKTERNSDNSSSADSISSDTPTSVVESSESHLTDSLKSDEASKSSQGSEKSKPSENDSSSDIVSVSSGNSSGNSQGNLDSGKGSKSEDTSSKNGTSSKSDRSNSSSSSSSSSSSVTDNDSTSVVTSTSQGLGNATGSSPTKVVHGKSQSDHKDSTGDSTSTDTTVVAGNQQSASEGIADPMISSSIRQASAFAESTLGKSAAESSNTAVLGAQLGIDVNTASIASTAAVLSANEALVHVPAMVDAAIPLAIPVLQSFAPSLGLGELAAMDTLAPVAGDLIVGFLPVEQMNLASAMQGVLSEIETLGEQMVGSAAGKWLYPFVFTALAATTVFQLATRRRRQLQRQSVWASESGIWSGSYFGRP